MTTKINFIIILLVFNNLLLAAERNSIQFLNIENGLSNNYVRTIFKDSQGLIWFGTDTGLDSYDGLQIINYAKRFNSPLKGAVQSIAELRPGIFLIGTSWGAFQYDIRQNKIIPLEFDITSLDVRQIFISSKRKIYLATDKGCYSLDTLTLRPERLHLKNSGNSFTSIVEDKNKNILIFGNNRMLLINPDKKVFDHVNILPSGYEISAAEQFQDILFLGTNHGLYAYSTSLKTINLVKATANLSVLSIEKDTKNNLYIGTDNAGLFQLNLKDKNLTVKGSTIFDNNLESAYSIYSLFADPSGVLWTGTFDKGIHFKNLNPVKRFETFTFEGSGNANIRSVFIDKNGDKFIGTRDGFVYHFNRERKLIAKTSLADKNKFRSNILLTLYPYPGNPDYLLAGTFGGGISLVNKKTLSASDFSRHEIFRKGSVYKFHLDQLNQLWIATLDGLYRYNLNNQSFAKLNTASVTGSNEIFTLSSDNKNKLWIGTKTGICYYSFSDKKLYQPEASKTYKYQCSSALVDSRGNAWFCFNKGGVLQLGPDLNEKLWITREIGLPENAPSSLVEDKYGNIWIGSSKGLFKVSANGGVHAFGMEDGLTGIGFCPESAHNDLSGNILWTNDKGLVTYLDNKNDINQTIPPIKLTDLFINGQRFDADTLVYVDRTSQNTYQIEIKGKSNNNLEFRLAALNYINSRRNQYSFLLEGVDKSWSKPVTNPVAAYNHLAPGNYILKVKASNNDDVWTPVPVEIRFSIQPYFYESLWFLILIAIVSGGVLLYFTRSYIVSMKSKILSQLDELKKKQTSPSTLKITEQKGNEISDVLLKYMSEQKPYLNPDFRQADVAAAIGYSVHDISQVLNVQLNQNFSDFVNSYRVEEVKKRMLTEDAKKYTFTAISMQCGFSAKSSFLRAFKKATNMTPSEYFKGIKQE